MRNFIIILAAMLGMFVAGHKYGRHQLRQDLRSAAGLDTSLLVELQQQDSLHRAQAQMWEAKAIEEADARIMIKEQYAIDLKRLRSQPPRIVQVPVVRLLECDSAIATGQSYKRQSELQQYQIMELREVISVQDTAIQYLSDIAEMAEQRYRDDQAVIATTQEILTKEKKRKANWRGVAVGSAIAFLISLL